MNAKTRLKAIALAAALAAAATPALAAMTVTPMPRNEDGAARFADRDKPVFAAAPTSDDEIVPDPRQSDRRAHLAKALAAQSHIARSALAPDLPTRRPVQCLDCETAPNRDGSIRR